MTVGTQLVEWLNCYEGLDFSEFNTEVLGSEDGDFALSKSPNKTVTEHIDGSRSVIEYYSVFARRTANMDAERTDALKDLAEFEEWLERQEEKENYPALPSGCTCTEIAVTSSSSVIELDEDKATYQIGISIEYLKERN